MPNEMNETINFVSILLAFVGTGLVVWWLYVLSWYQCEKMFTSPDRPWRPVRDSDPGQKQYVKEKQISNALKQDVGDNVLKEE